MSKLETEKLQFIYEKGTEEEQEYLSKRNKAYLNGYLSENSYAKIQNEMYKKIKERGEK